MGGPSNLVESRTFTIQTPRQNLVSNARAEQRLSDGQGNLVEDPQFITPQKLVSNFAV
jgi:hypothetical protein